MKSVCDIEEMPTSMMLLEIRKKSNGANGEIIINKNFYF